MYVPASFGVSDQRILESFIDRYAFATLITSSPGGLVASHILGTPSQSCCGGTRGKDP